MRENVLDVAGLLLVLGVSLCAVATARAQTATPGQAAGPAQPQTLTLPHPASKQAGSPQHAAPPQKGPSAAPIVPVHPAPASNAAATTPHAASTHAPSGTHSADPHAKAPAKPSATTEGATAAAPDQAAKPAAAAAAKKAAEGQPPPNVPRFAALRFDDVNMRVGPGPRYPITWVYKRKDLPVEVDREFDIWRLIRDADGVKGWVSQASLYARRTFIVTTQEATLRDDMKDTAAAVAVLKHGVIGRIRSCAAGADWCEVQTGDYRGYLKRAQFWGTLSGEAVNP
jgi:SH3-like domain-containing protein